MCPIHSLATREHHLWNKPEFWDNLAVIIYQILFWNLLCLFSIMLTDEDISNGDLLILFFRKGEEKPKVNHRMLTFGLPFTLIFYMYCSKYGLFWKDLVCCKPCRTCMYMREPWLLLPNTYSRFSCKILSYRSYLNKSFMYFL